MESVEVICPVCGKSEAKAVLVPCKKTFANDCKETECELNFSDFCEYYGEHGAEDLRIPLRRGCIGLIGFCDCGVVFFVYKA